MDTLDSYVQACTMHMSRLAPELCTYVQKRQADRLWQPLDVIFGCMNSLGQGGPATAHLRCPIYQRQEDNDLEDEDAAIKWEHGLEAVLLAGSVVQGLHRRQPQRRPVGGG